MNYLVMKVVQGVYRLASNTIRDEKDLYQGLLSRAEGWPQDATGFVDPKPLEVHANADRTPPDFLWGIGDATVLSAKAKEVVGDVEGGEYLPIAIVDENKQPLNAPYYVLNLVGLVDCLNLPACEYRPNRIDPEYISIIKKMAVDEGRIPAGRSLLRMRHYPGKPLVHRSLAEKILHAGLTGAEFRDVDRYRT